MSEVVKKENTEIAATPSLLTPEIIESADADKLEKLMALQERWDANQAKKAFDEAMQAFKENPPTLYKDKSVQAGSAQYSHVSLEFASMAIGNALLSQGITHAWESSVGEDGMKVTCVLTHKAGHVHRGASMTAGADKSGSKNSVQALGSTATYLQRYTLLMTTGLAVPGMDDDAMAAVELQEDEFEEITALMDQAKITAEQFCKRWKIGSVNQLPGNKFRSAKLGLQQRIKQIEKGE